MPIEAPFTEVIDTTTRFQYKAGFLGVGEYGVDAPGVIAVAEGNFFVADDAEVGDRLHVDTNGVGTALLPSITVNGDIDTGIYSDVNNQFKIAVGGNEIVRIAGNGLFTTDGAAATPSLGFFNDQDTGFWRPGGNQIGVSTFGVERMRAGAGGIIYIGDGTTTTNANMIIGLDVNQLGNDDEIAAFRSTDVAHGITDLAETNVYGNFMKDNPLGGGLRISGYRDTGGPEDSAIAIMGHLGENADTGKTIANRGIIHFRADVKSGTGIAGVNVDGNVFSVATRNTTLMILDAEGTLHLDLGGNGTPAAPSFTLAGDVDTGLYLQSPGNFGVVCAGSEIMRWNTNGYLLNVDGTSAIGAFRFLTDTDVGFYRPGSDQFGIIVGGFPFVLGDAAITLAAGNDLDGGDIFAKVQDGGPDATIIGGYDGGHFNLTMGDGSDAGVASAANGGDGGDYELNPGLEGDGDGIGVHGLRGVIHEWERLGHGEGRRIRGWTDQNDVGALTVISELTMTLGDNEAWQIILHVVAMESDGTDRALYHLESLWYRDGAGATQQGATISLATIESDANWDVDFNGNGNDVEIRVNGNGDTVIWKIIVEWIKLTT